MTSNSLMHKDTVEFDGVLLDVTYHENGDDIVLDKVTRSGTGKHYDVDINRQQQLKDKLSGRF